MLESQRNQERGEQHGQYDACQRLVGIGGIYATRLANFIEVPIRENDMELPPAFLDFNAMVRHQFVERNEQSLQYRLIFDRRRAVHITLLVPTFFNF